MLIQSKDLNIGLDWIGFEAGETKFLKPFATNLWGVGREKELIGKPYLGGLGVRKMC